MNSSLFFGLIGIITVFVSNAVADTPANCTFKDIQGKWVFYEGRRDNDHTIQCNSIGVIARKIKVNLVSPNIVVDEYGNIGTWSMVYNEAFEVTVNQRTYFAFSVYKQEGPNVTSICNQTFPGWSHDVTLRHWACFYGHKLSPVPVKTHQDPFATLEDNSFVTREEHETLVRKVNSVQRSWYAELHEPFVDLPSEHLLKLRGGKRSWLAHRPSPALPDYETKISADALPLSFDWRNVNGRNFVSQVRDQGTCGSCYAFASVGMLESRLRVQTNNTLQILLSPQQIVSCSHYSQGCEGGFPYLVAGKYGKDYGIVVESCDPYTGHDSVCSKIKCDKHYTASYQYVGGYFGACNEELMRLALLTKGPLAVAFEVYPDFMHYKGGVYHHTGLKFNSPFEVVNHAVLLVGYGVDNSTGEKYWIVKNSWGENWGENGYFRIRRGVDEVGIESIAVEVVPIP